MRKKSTIAAVIAFIILPSFAYADSIMWTKTYDEYMFLSYAILPLWEHHYRKYFKPLVEIQYHADVTNLDTGQIVSCGSTVPRGTMLTYSIKPHTYQDVFWLAHGFIYDSPYGSWTNDAAFPEEPMCSDKNFFVQGTLPGARARFYFNLSVAPPTKTITGLEGVRCETDDESLSCQMDNIGTFNVNFNFAQTRGRFYSGYNQESSRDTCSVNGRIPLKTVFNPNNRQLIFYYSTPAEYDQRYNLNRGFFGIKIPVGSLDPISDFTVRVPKQVISCPITVVESVGAPPNRPTVSQGGSACTINTPYSIFMVATDPDRNRIRYLIDWDNNGTTDQIVPSGTNAYVPSGTRQTASRTFSTPGDKVVRVRTQDVTGLTSEATVFRFNCSGRIIDDPAACIPSGRYCNAEGRACRKNQPRCEEFCTPCPAGCRSGVCIIPPSPDVRLFIVNPTLVKKESIVRVFWDVAPGTVKSCTVRGTNGDGSAGNVWNKLSSGNDGQASSPIIGQTTYTLKCTALPGSLSPDISISVPIQVAPIFREK